MPEDLPADVAHYPLSGEVHRVDLRRSRRSRENEDDYVQAHDPQDALERLAREVGIEERGAGRVRLQVPVHGDLG